MAVERPVGRLLLPRAQQRLAALLVDAVGILLARSSAPTDRAKAA
jgi:hypothetical protein